MTQLLNLKLLAFICAIGIAGSGICLVQHFLAKNKNGSLLYWRNWPLFADIVFQLSRNIFIEHIILAAKIFFSSDQKIKLIFMTSHFRLLRFKKLFEKLDDVIDSMTPEQILSLGDSVLGPTMSPLLGKILNEEDLGFINQLISDGLLTREELFSFCNLIVHKLYIQAKLSSCYEQELSPQLKAALREQIAQENIEVTGVYFIFVAHFIKKDKRISDLVSQNENNELTYALLKKIYPESSLVGELDQIKHDTIEHRHDLQQELFINKISPNYFLAQLEKNGQLIDAQKELNKLSNRPVTYYELPIIIQQNYLQVRRNFIQQALKIGIIASLIFIVTWEYQYRIGFYTIKPRSWRTPLSSLSLNLNSAVESTTSPDCTEL